MNRKRQEAAGEIIEEMDYVNTSVSTVAKTAATSDRKSPSFTQSFLPIAVCWAILLVIMSLRIYFTSVMSENNGKLMLHVTGLETQNQQLEEELNQLKENQTSLLTDKDNLNRAYAVLESNVTDLKSQNQEVETQNQQLKEEKKNLTARIQELQKLWNQNISQAQMSVNLYCPIRKGQRKCNPCLPGWIPKPPNCYAVNNAEKADQKTWESAQESCKGKDSDLPVIANEQEKTSVGELLWNGITYNEFWIGLKAENGKWKWLDGSELTDNSWIEDPATVGQCALLHKNNTWTSEDCNKKYQWICQQKALTLT
ncbi:C-type lectin domain family 10 member A [Larimichthys crocea]|uniref:C-type lectin domain family 10 member A n=1 Tax=Larimichthys crocea TaxID=215358 RepID=UPI000F5E2E33|nr:C-type lectin domain family 10 member A [Larimichthys crocea]